MEETPSLSLPTLGRSNDQIFFISAAQVYGNKEHVTI